MATRQRRPLRVQATKEGKGSRPSGRTLTSVWLAEVMSVINKPAVAMALFVMGVVFIVVASKQVKLFIGFLERQGIYLRQGQTLSNFLAASVFVVVWLDILVLLEVKKICKGLFHNFNAWYALLSEVLDEMATKEQNKLKNKRRRESIN